MKLEVLATVGKTVAGIVTTLVIGEVIGGAVSRPIQSMRIGKGSNVDVDKLTTMLADMENRIRILENQSEEDEA